jgi:hypothetical protein
MLKPLTHYARYERSRSLAGGLVVLAVVIGTALVLLVDWLNNLPNLLTR